GQLRQRILQRLDIVVHVRDDADLHPNPLSLARMAGKRVIVIGTGVAGMSAALAAASSGAQVTVLEKADKLGGTTAWGGGGIWIPANPYTTAEGLPDTEEDALLYLRSVGLGDSDATLAERYVRQ